MSTDNITLLSEARTALRGKWGIAIITFFVYVLLTASPSAVHRHGIHFSPFSLLTFIIAGPLMLGAAMFSLSIARGKEGQIEQLFKGFNFFSTAFITYVIYLVYIFLWMLLFIIPGIIAALGYSMTFYILADNPSIKPQDALKASKTMMNGYKLKLFYLYLRFFLLAILCILTLGIGFLWLVPYIHVTTAKFYDDINTREFLA